MEILCQHVASLGLINASKETQKSIAAHAVAAEFAQSFVQISDGDAQRVFKAVGKRLKQLYKAEPLEYVMQLPASPAEFLKLHPLMAKAIFSRDNLPCACPLNALSVSHAASRIQSRRGPEAAQSSSPDMQAAQFQPMMAMLMSAVSRLVANSDQDRSCPVRVLTLAAAQSPGTAKFLQLADKVAQPDAPASLVHAHAAPPAHSAGDMAPPSLRFFPLEDVKPSMSEHSGDNRSAHSVDTKPSSTASPMLTSILEARAALAEDRLDANPAKPAKQQKLKPAKLTQVKSKQAKSKKNSKKAGVAGITQVKLTQVKSNYVKSKQAKPKSWLKLRPTGCSTCRHVPGCTRSCWLKRCGHLPK